MLIVLAMSSPLNGDKFFTHPKEKTCLNSSDNISSSLTPNCFTKREDKKACILNNHIKTLQNGSEIQSNLYHCSSQDKEPIQVLKQDKGTIKQLNRDELDVLKRKARNNDLKIVALETISQLARKCAESGIIAELNVYPFAASTNSFYSNASKRRKRQTFEVEKIVDYVIKNNKLYYAIKWKDWDSSHNTWEPVENLFGCLQMVQKFSNKEFIHVSSEDAFKSIVKLIYTLDKITSKSYSDPAIILKLTQTSLAQYKNNPSHLTLLKKQLKEVYTPFTKCLEDNENDDGSNYILMFNHLMNELNILKNFESLEQFFDFIDERKKLQPILKKWEQEYNLKIKQETLQAEIRIENLVDLEGPPDNFSYISSCKIDPSIVYFDEDPPIWCDCNSNCYDNKANCCPSNMDGKFVYTRNGTLRAEPQTPIFECNKKCKCSIKCPNRSIQRGRQHKVCIFRTENGCGWGVKALEKIPKGAFVMEYVGEIITVEEADRRGKEYDAEGRTYLFDLDFNVDAECLYVIDAAHYGDISHFVNHSCDPNLEVYVAWINNYNMRLSRIAFFSKRIIKTGEQLTFDYKMTSPYRHSESHSSKESFNLNLTHKSESLIPEKGPKVIVEQIHRSSPQPTFDNDLIANEDLTNHFLLSNLPNNILFEGDQSDALDLENSSLIYSPPHFSYPLLSSSQSCFNLLDDYNLPLTQLNKEGTPEASVCDQAVPTSSPEYTSKRILCKCGAANCRYFLF